MHTNFSWFGNSITIEIKKLSSFWVSFALKNIVLADEVKTYFSPPENGYIICNVEFFEVENVSN